MDRSDGGSHSTRGTATCSGLQSLRMVSPGGRAVVRVIPSLPSPDSLEAVRRCRTGGSAGKRKPGLTRGVIVSRRGLCCRRRRNECERVGWLVLCKGGHNACESVCMAMCVGWTKGPRVHGRTRCRSLDVWSLDRRQSVSNKPSPPQANLQHRYLSRYGTGLLLGTGWRRERHRLCHNRVASRKAERCPGWCEAGACRVRRAKGTDGLADRWQIARWDEWTGDAIAPRLN